MDVLGSRTGKPYCIYTRNSGNRSLLITIKITCVIGLATYFWIVDFPENADRSFYFLSKAERDIAVRRIQEDRGDVKPAPFSVAEIARHFLDPKIYGFAASFFLLVRLENHSIYGNTKTHFTELGFNGSVIFPSDHVSIYPQSQDEPLIAELVFRAEWGSVRISQYFYRHQYVA